MDACAWRVHEACAVHMLQRHDFQTYLVNLESSELTLNCSISNINYIYKRDGLTYFQNFLSRLLFWFLLITGHWWTGDNCFPFLPSLNIGYWSTGKY